MHGLHEQVLADACGILATLTILAIASTVARKELHKILTNCRHMAQDVRGEELSLPLSSDPLHLLFPKQKPVQPLPVVGSQTTALREGCPHTFGDFIDGSVPRPQQLGALTFGCVSCGWQLKTKEDLQEFFAHISRR
jgi:hypothetical protein